MNNKYDQNKLELITHNLKHFLLFFSIAMNFSNKYLIKKRKKIYCLYTITDFDAEK